MNDPTIPILSVTEFNTMVNQVLTEMRVWVQGEISGYRVSQGKWVTFDLKDEGSKVNCFMTVYQLDQELEDGMEVKVFGSPRIYVPYGKYSFTVQRIEPVGEGALRRAFELTKAKLEQEGLFLPEHKKELPRFPETIGIVTSQDAAAYTDFLRILDNRWGGVETILRPCLVQGDKAPGQIVEAIEWFNKYHPVDVIVITRGGGSLEDLQAFNSEQVCRAIFASRIPIVCGIGHERDLSLAELVADVRASTPSNAAEIIVPDRKEVNGQLDAIISQMDRVLHDQINKFDALEQHLHYAFGGYLSSIEQWVSKVGSFSDRLKLSSDRILQQWSDQLGQIDKLLLSYSPNNVVKRGYSITRLGNGKVVTSVKAVRKGEMVRTELRDGVFESEVRDDKQLTIDI